MRLLLLSLAAAPFLLAADAPANPFDPAAVTTLGVSGVLAVGFGLVLTGKLVPGVFLDKSEKRADAATLALTETTQTVRAASEAVAKLSTEHEQERKAHAEEIAKITAEHQTEVRGFMRELHLRETGRRGDEP